MKCFRTRERVSYKLLIVKKMDLNNTMNNHQKTKYKIGIVEVAPWSYKITGEETWKGFCIDLIQSLAQRMHFEYELIPSVDEETVRVPNGIFADLVSGKTDIMVAAVAMTAARGALVEYITPYFEYSGISIVIRKPRRKSSLFKFITVLSMEVWLSIIHAVVITAFALWLTEKFTQPKKCSGSQSFTLKESFWFAITSFASQGNGKIPSTLPHRVLIAAYWVFVLVMMTTFTANMAAFLTIERLQTPIASLWELLKQSRIKYTVVENSHAHFYFRNMKFAEDTLFRIWKDLALTETTENESKYRTWDYPVREEYGPALTMIERNNPVPNASFGFQKVLDNEHGEFALIHDAIEIKYQIVHDCRLIEVGEIFGERPYSIAVQKGSKLVAGITNTILDLQEERYFETLSTKYWNSSRFKKCYDENELDQGVTLDSLGGVFISVICGIILSLIILILEISREVRRKKISPAAISSNKYYTKSAFECFGSARVSRNDRLMKMVEVQKKHLKALRAIQLRSKKMTKNNAEFRRA